MEEIKKIDQLQINNAVWKACDTFRGVLNSAQYKDYILTFLFIKYLSDVWKEHKENYMKELSNNEERVARKMSREPFQIPEVSRFDYIYENRDAEDIGEIINKGLAAIEEANGNKLINVFRGIDFNSEALLGQTKDRNRMLRHLISDFQNLDLRPSRIEDEDIIGNVYEYLIEMFAGSEVRKGGEFYTPAAVAILIAKLMKAKPGDKIADPACGSGSLLVRVAKEIGNADFSIYGQEKNGSTWALAKMNMFLHGIIDNATIRWGDTLNNPLLLENGRLMTFNISAANPPFSLDKWGAEDANNDPYKRFNRGIPPKSKGDYAFILHMIETMDEQDGRAAVIMPHGVLFRGSSERKIRKKLIEENLLDAVIGLPANLFYATNIPACILIFKKNRIREDIIFIDASSEYEKGKNKNILPEDSISKIVKIYENYEAIDKYSYVASIEDIKENEYNLNIPRYVDTFEEEEELDMEASKKRIEKIDSELEQIQIQMKKYLDELGL